MVINCFPLLYICPKCDEVCICWHFGTPGFYVRAPQDPKKNFIFWILSPMVCIGLLPYWHEININKRIDVNHDGHKLIIGSAKIAKDIKKITSWYIFLPCTYVSCVMRSLWHFWYPWIQHTVLPRAPKKWTKKSNTIFSFFGF